MDIEIYDKAHAILDQRRAEARAENDRRISEINAAIPEIKEINDAIFNTGKELIRIIMSAGNKDVSEQIESVRQSNLGAQRVSEQLLTSHGYPADYLNIQYFCPHCKDTGYIGSEFCDCMKTLFSKLSANQLNKNAHLTLSSFETFSLNFYQGDDFLTMEKILNFSRNYAAQFNSESGSILMFGNTGLGKTHLSLAIANVVIKKGFGVLYDSVINILRNIEKEHFSHEHSTEMLDLVMATDLLILDDLGTEYENKFYNSTIYNIINTRLNRNKPTIINTNMGFDGISKRYDERVFSRLTGRYTCLEFKGEDVRLQIKRQNITNK